jgi:nucleoside-diphosphate-sugar epimerase
VFNINAFGALKVINAAQEAECEGILQVSSAEIYGEGARHHDSDVDSSKKIDELDAVVPHSSYGAAKAAIDAMVQVRWKEAKTPVIALRQFNCVGERETHPYIVPEIVGQIFHGGPPIRLGNNSFRDFLYAGDAVRMAVELLEKGQFGEVYNLGSESGIKIYDLARLLCEIVSDGVVKGNDAEIVEDARRKRPWEIWHLQSNNAKIHSVIETRPTVSLEEALRRTVNYYLVSGKKWCWE